MDDVLDQVRAVLSTTAERWLSLTEKLHADLLDRPAAPGEWSARDCLGHLLDTESIFPARARSLMSGQDFEAFDPDAEGSDHSRHTAAQLAATFAQHRAENLALLATITPADMDRTARHSELGPVTLGQLLNEWAAHDLMHTVQAERALMQPFVYATGPWRLYFQDHDLQAGLQEWAAR
jgi:uncharacterized damage-inducible protein DinB